jgi:hypothetical protein
MKYRANREGIRELLKSPDAARLVMARAGAVAAAASGAALSDGTALPVDVGGAGAKGGKIDRVAAFVTLTHPAALRAEHKYGFLAAATRAAGLTFKPKKGKK